MVTEIEFKTHPRKAKLDSFDDGYGPYMECETLSERVRLPAYWDDFKEWAFDHLGQGYSLACVEGGLIDEVTRWAYIGYRAGRKHERTT